MAHSHQREVAVFEAALELPLEQRPSYLEQTCAGDADLLRRVQALLQAEEQRARFLETVAPDSMLPLSERPGDRIGTYKLLEQIGEGGCGVVYMAEQEAPIRRRVALKIIKLGMDTKQVIARFEAERQALALMEHPNIAKVHDAGATLTGRPYFVMELVRGYKITEYCDEQRLSTRQRLELFIQVCQAVQHAHQKGIIHRDLKPSNILVTVNDGVPVVKVIDFGIAKATSGERLTDKTVFTAFDQFMGTPAYMSPEQAEMTSLDIDTRSDVYSMGVLLYELLTGQTPLDARRLLQAGLDEMRRTIREQTPARPSMRLGTLTQEQLTTAARHRSTEPPKLMQSVRDDLDWIAMKCLEKDRRRRYQTAIELSTDVQRRLHNEPVSARPPSRLYKFQKTVQRHKFSFAAAVGIVVSLLAGIVVGTFEASRARHAEAEQTHLRRQAEAGEQKAKTEAAKAEEVARLLEDVFSGVGPEVAKGRDATILREILDQDAERLKNSFTNQPVVQGALLRTLAWMYKDLGEFTKSEELGRQALELGKVSIDETNELVQANALESLAQDLLQRSEWGKAESALRDCLALRQKLAPDPWLSLNTKSMLGFALLGLGKTAEAESFVTNGYFGLRELVGNERLSVRDNLTSAEDAMVALHEACKDWRGATEWKPEIERVRHMNDEGAIRHWLILAPIKLEPDQIAEEALLHEQLRDESSSRPWPGGKVALGAQHLTWRDCLLPDYAIDFNRLLGQETPRSVAYAVCYIDVASPQKGLALKVGSDDFARVYLNGKDIYDYDVPRGRPFTPDEDTISDVELKAGLNVVVFKVVNDTKNWRGSLRFATKEGLPVQGIHARTTPGQ